MGLCEWLESALLTWSNDVPLGSDRECGTKCGHKEIAKPSCPRLPSDGPATQCTRQVHVVHEVCALSIIDHAKVSASSAKLEEASRCTSSTSSSRARRTKTPKTHTYVESRRSHMWRHRVAQLWLCISCETTILMPGQRDALANNVLAVEQLGQHRIEFQKIVLATNATVTGLQVREPHHHLEGVWLLHLSRLNSSRVAAHSSKTTQHHLETSSSLRRSLCSLCGPLSSHSSRLSRTASRSPTTDGTSPRSSNLKCVFKEQYRFCVSVSFVASLAPDEYQVLASHTHAGQLAVTTRRHHVLHTDANLSFLLIRGFAWLNGVK